MTSLICRLCLREGQLMSLFHNIGGMSLSDKIMKFASINIRIGDQLPSRICGRCVDRVNASYDFKVLCENSDTILRKRLNDDKLSFPIKNEQGSDLDTDYVPVECKYEYDNDDNRECVIKKESGDNDKHEKFSKNIDENQDDDDSLSEGAESDEVPLSRVSVQSLSRKRKSTRDSKEQKGNTSSTKEWWKRKCECQICGRILSNKYRLKFHMRTHTGERGYSCSYCGKSYTSNQGLKAHERNHIEENQVSCDICGKSFSNSDNLRLHKKSHSGVRPYKCALCPSAFKLRRHMNIHMKIHSGEKNFKCHLCEKAFVLNDYLQSHLKSHSGERNFVCNICGKTMTRSHHLKLHMMTHTGDRPYKCEICNLSFIQKGYWMKHMNRHKTNDSEQPIEKCNKSIDNDKN